MLTPPDVLSQMSLAGPLILLYEGSIWSVRIVERKAKAALRASLGHDVVRVDAVKSIAIWFMKPE